MPQRKTTRTILRNKAKKRTLQFLTNPTPLSLQEILSKSEAFPHRPGGEIKKNDFIGHVSYSGRFPWQKVFFKKLGNKIQSFADVGCALFIGAPTTIEARKHLPKNTKVIAVDAPLEVPLIPPRIEMSTNGQFMSFPKAKEKMEAAGITPLIHSIIQRPLPEKVDCIRFANVSIYLNELQLRNALRNIFKSLNEGGYLLSETAAFRKTRNAFVKVAKATDLK